MDAYPIDVVDRYNATPAAQHFTIGWYQRNPRLIRGYGAAIKMGGSASGKEKTAEEQSDNTMRLEQVKFEDARTERMLGSQRTNAYTLGDLPIGT